MKQDSDIAKKLAVYDEAFDFYMDRGKMPENIPSDDLLGGFMQQALADNPQLDTQDPTWIEILKEEVLKFIHAMLELFEPLEKIYQEEKHLIQVFSGGSIEKKRHMWQQVYGTIKQKYTPEEVNIEGYIQQFQNNDADLVFGPMIKDWDKACDERLFLTEQSYIDRYKNNWETRVKECGQTDYMDRKKIDQIFYRYPQLVEIVRIMGREQPQRDDEKDETIIKYIPLLPSPPQPAVEIEEVTNGNDLQHLLPIETAILSSPKTEGMFYFKYATHQLQQFANKPKMESRMKKEQIHKREPRLEKGPIIVSIDTSGSMEGKPLKLATCLLKQLLRMAKKQKRNCFLISFSVRAKHIDLSIPGSWAKLNKFLSDSFSGGTDGNQMLKAGIDMLNSNKYAMADMLIISDFIFPEPNKRIQELMREEHDKGTRFYGLQIDSSAHGYDNILDKIWQVRI